MEVFIKSPCSLKSGMVLEWSGSILTIPSGFFLCNGANSTPDLRDRFLVGAGSTYAVGVTGGEVNHILTVAEMPSHHHHVTSYLAGTQVASYTNGSTTPTANDTDTVGGDGAHENRPPYYALAYIMMG